MGNKSREIEEFLNGFTTENFGRTRDEAYEKRICVVCGKPAVEFRDERSRKEYEISMMCQKCQDETFM